MPINKPRAAHLLASPDDVEAQFYEALREADLDKLMALWADDDEVFCVHPGGPRVVGQQAIRVAFEAVFASSGRIHVQAERAPGILHGCLQQAMVGQLCQRVFDHTGRSYVGADQIRQRREKTDTKSELERRDNLALVR